MIPVIFQIGPIPLNSFGLMMICCFFAAWKRLSISFEEAGEDPLLAEPLIVLGAITGFVGSRINYILTNRAEFLADPAAMIFTGAGFVFYGGFLCAAAGSYLFLRSKKKSFIHFADLGAPALAIGYAVGRIGCHLSGDGDYGGPTTLPWGFSYLLGIVPTHPGVLVHPTPIYETIVALLIAWALLHLQRNGMLSRTGRLFGLYLLLSAIARFLVEFLRIEPMTRFGITEAQVVAIFVALAGAALLLRPERPATR